MVPKNTYKGLEVGVIYRVHENNEIIPHVKGYQYPIYRTKTHSDNMNKFITKIAICPECGAYQESTQLKLPICRKCRKVEYRKELKAGVKKVGAAEIAFEIVGDYPRAKREVPPARTWRDIYDEIEMEML